MKILRLIGRVATWWLLLAPIPLIVIDLFNIGLDWNGGWRMAVVLWSVPVFLLAAAIDPLAHGAIGFSQYAMIYLALAIALIVLARWRRARRAAAA